MTVRSVEERLVLALPGRVRPLRLVGVLPPGSVLRRRLLKRIFARGMAALIRGDLALFELAFSPTASFRVVGGEALGLEESYEGPSGVRGFFAEWTGHVAIGEIVPEGVYDLGDRVLLKARVEMRGRASGVSVRQTCGLLYELDRGQIVRNDIYVDFADAVDALDLRTPQRAFGG